MKKKLPYPYIYDWSIAVHRTLKNLGLGYSSESLIDLERNKNGKTNIGYYSSLQKWLVSDKLDLDECSDGNSDPNHVVLWRY